MRGYEGSAVSNGGGLFWNEETQRWDDGTAPAAPATPPPPGRPDHAPPPPGGVGDPDAPTSTAAPRPPGAPPGDGTGTPAAPVPGPAPYGPWPSAGPPSAPSMPSAPFAQPVPPAEPAGYSRRTVWAVLGAAAAAGVVVALVLSTALGGGENGDPRSAAVSASDTPTETDPSPSPRSSSGPATASPSPSPDEPPAGYTLYDDPQGFRIAVPDGWQRRRSTVNSQYGMDVVNYRDSGGHRRIQVYEVRESSPDESFDLYLSEDVPKPRGFRVLSRVKLDGGSTGSRLEYLADSLKGEPEIGTWHVVDQRFRAADGKVYAIASYGSDADGRDDEREALTTAVDWFCPPSTTCSS